MSTAAVTAERYEDLIRRSGLVDASHLDSVMNELAAEKGSRPLDSAILAQKLLDRQLITTWQNEKLMQGRHKGFFLCQYKLLQHLSKGGMSEVYSAEDTTTRQKVAIKVFPPALIEQSSYLARFQQEARTQQALDHPNIVRATDFGCAGKIHYLVMEYVDGIDLHRLVEQRGPLPFREAAGFIVQAAEALEYAHGRHMVHRDIKPG
ncbi:MAG TPA: serine/threonine-protein kinase, partial [Pirellulales bacterium]